MRRLHLISLSRRRTPNPLSQSVAGATFVPSNLNFLIGNTATGGAGGAGGNGGTGGTLAIQSFAGSISMGTTNGGRRRRRRGDGQEWRINNSGADFAVSAFTPLGNGPSI